MWGTERRRHRPRPWDNSSGAEQRRDHPDGDGLSVVVSSSTGDQHGNAALMGGEAPLSTASYYYGAVDGAGSAVASSERPRPPEDHHPPGTTTTTDLAPTTQHTAQGGVDNNNSNNNNNNNNNNHDNHDNHVNHDENGNHHDENDNHDEEYDEDPNEDRDDEEDDVDHSEAVGRWTRRVRCLFALLTWPVVPLGTFAALSLLWMLVAGFVLDVNQFCAHSMHPYAIASIALAAYLPYHTSVRARLGVRGATMASTAASAAAVRRCDQCVRTLVLLYVYGGVTLLQTCHDDRPDNGGTSDLSHPLPPNACAATCPHLYAALAVYVAALELLVLSLLLPLLCLPCLYLWVLRQVETSGPGGRDNAAVLEEWRIDHPEAFPLRRGEYPFFPYGSGGGGAFVAADDVMALLEPVKLVGTTTTTLPVAHASSIMEHDNDDFGGAYRVVRHADDAVAASIPRVVVILPRDGPDDASLGIPVPETARSCCICLSDFPIVRTDNDDGTTDDLEAGGHGVPTNDSDAVVRTPQCHHLFHGRCIAKWVGGRWPPRLPTGAAPTPSAPPPHQRRAKRTTCPLCRKDLRRPRSASTRGDDDDNGGVGGDDSSS